MKISCHFALVLLGFVFPVVGFSQTHEIYVSPSGSFDAPGTQSQPTSFLGAYDKIDVDDGRPVEIIIQSGTYRGIEMTWTKYKPETIHITSNGGSLPRINGEYDKARFIYFRKCEAGPANIKVSRLDIRNYIHNGINVSSCGAWDDPDRHISNFEFSENLIQNIGNKNISADRMYYVKDGDKCVRREGFGAIALKNTSDSQIYTNEFINISNSYEKCDSSWANGDYSNVPEACHATLEDNLEFWSEKHNTPNTRGCVTGGEALPHAAYISAHSKNNKINGNLVRDSSAYSIKFTKKANNNQAKLNTFIKSGTSTYVANRTNGGIIANCAFDNSFEYNQGYSRYAADGDLHSGGFHVGVHDQYGECGEYSMLGNDFSHSTDGLGSNVKVKSIVEGGSYAWYGVCEAGSSCVTSKRVCLAAGETERKSSNENICTSSGELLRCKTSADLGRVAEGRTCSLNSSGKYRWL